jgi:hypothetical protein
MAVGTLMAVEGEIRNIYFETRSLRITTLAL